MTGERYLFSDKRYLGDTWERSFSAGTRAHSLFGAMGSETLLAAISYALDEELAFLPHDANLAQHLGNSG